MTLEIQKLHNVWIESQNRGLENTELPQITFNELTNSIVSSGPFYYYIIDFFDRSLSYVSPGIYDILGLDPETVTFDDMLDCIHPDDVDFVSKAEAFAADFFSNNIPREKVLKYKKCYNINSKLKNGQYGIVNHQAIMLTLDSVGGYGKCLNIHTLITHLATANNYKFSIMGLNGEPSYMNLNVGMLPGAAKQFSKREIDIIKCIADGLNNNEIGNSLFISAETVKKHRTNILRKTECKNTAQLIKNSVLQGLI